MRALELDLVAPARRAFSPGIWLLAAAAIAAFVLVSAHDDLQRERARLEQERSALERAARGLAATAVAIDPKTLQGIETANGIIDRLALPWDRLFGAVEAAAIDSVVLTGIAPDARAGSVQISADAASENAMIDYLRRLEQQAAFSDVYMLNHQREPRNGARPYRFTVTAIWLPGATR